MCRYLLLKSNLDILSLKVPDVFSEDYKVIQVMDERELSKILKKERQKNPDLSLSFAVHPVSGREKTLKTSASVISFKQGDYYSVYKQSEILYVKASGSYSEIIFHNQKSIMVTFHLADIESKLSEELFVRIHKSVIVNLDCVTRFIGNTVFLCEKEFPIGRKFRKTLITRLNLLGYSTALYREE